METLQKGGDGESAPGAHGGESEMSIIIMMAKGMFLVLLAVVAFSALVAGLGFEPAAARQMASCAAQPLPGCIFTIL